MTDPNPSKQYTNVFLKNGILEENDYVIVCKEAYNLLVDKYGHDDTEIKRWCISISQDSSILQIEVHLKPIQVIGVLSAKKTIKMIQISRKETVKALIEKLQRLFKTPPGTVSRLWKVDHHINLTQILNTDKNIVLKGALLLNDREDIENSEIADEDIVLFESKIKSQT